MPLTLFVEPWRQLPRHPSSSSNPTPPTPPTPHPTHPLGLFVPSAQFIGKAGSIGPIRVFGYTWLATPWRGGALACIRIAHLPYLSDLGRDFTARLSNAGQLSSQDLSRYPGLWSTKPYTTFFPLFLVFDISSMNSTVFAYTPSPNT